MISNGITVARVLGVLALSLLAGGIVSIAIALTVRVPFIDTVLGIATMCVVFWWLRGKWLVHKGPDSTERQD